MDFPRGKSTDRTPLCQPELPHNSWKLQYAVSMAANFAEWLTNELETRGIGDRQMAKYLGVSHTSVRAWRLGFTTPSWESAGKIADHLKIDPRFVRRIVGYSVDEFTEPKRADAERQDLSPRDLIVELESILPVPIVIENQMASAGGGQIVQERIWIDRPRARKNARAIQVRGYSMEPEVHDGDTVVFDPDETAYDGNLVVATVGEEMFVKRYRRKFDAFVLEGNDGLVMPADDARLEGRVIQIVRDVA